MSTTKAVAALQPGNKLDSLRDLAPNYVIVRQTLTSLLTFPNLETIAIGDEDAERDNLRQLVVNGSTNFSSLEIIDINLARKVIGYGSALRSIMGELSLDLVVLTMQSLADGYAQEYRASSEQNQEFFGEFDKYISNLNGKMVQVSANIADLDTQIQEQSSKLGKANIQTTIINAIGTVYKLSKEPRDSDVQLAGLLNVGIDTIAGDFDAVFEDRARLKQLLNGLTNIKTQLTDIQALFKKLTKNLGGVITDSKALLEVWDDLVKRMDPIKDDQKDLTKKETETLDGLWKKAGQNATDYINDVTAPIPQKPLTVQEQVAALSAAPLVPQSQNEIRFHKMAHRVLSANLAPLPPSERLGGDQMTPEEKVVDGVLGPPEDTQRKLEELATDTGRIIAEFDNLLQQPYIEQLSCTDPLDAEQTTNIFNMVAYYRKEYLALQQETIPVARKLKAYSTSQSALLPLVSAKADPPEGYLTLQEFIDTNLPLVGEYLEAANALSEKTIRVKNDWDNAVNVVQKAIGECESKINSLNKTIDEMTDQQKKQTLYGVLAGLGALAAFAAAAFIPGVGILAAIAVGGSLGGVAIAQLQKANQIGAAINEMKGALSTAQSTKKKLEDLLPFMLIISASLSEVSGIWSDIATALTQVDNFYKILNGPTGPVLLEKLKPTIITQWVLVAESCQKYINIVVT